MIHTLRTVLGQYIRKMMILHDESQSNMSTGFSQFYVYLVDGLTASCELRKTNWDIS